MKGTRTMITGRGILDARVLIVDDPETNVRMLKRLLSDAGYTQVPRSSKRIRKIPIAVDPSVDP